MSIETNNTAGIFAVEGKAVARVASRRIGLTLAAAMLAGTALVPAKAQIFDVNGALVVVTDFAAPPINGAVTILNDDAVNVGTLRVNADAALLFGGDLTNGLGVLAFTKAGSEALTLSGLNSYSGQTSVLAGTLAAGSVTAFSASSEFLVSGMGTLDLAGFDNSVVSINGNGAVTNSGLAPAVLTINNSMSGNFAGSISGDLALVKTGAQAQVLGGASSFTGGVTLQQGLLRIGNDTAMGTGALTVTGNSSLATVAMPLITATNDINIAAGVQLTVNPSGMGSALVLGGVIAGDGDLIKTGAQTLQLDGANSYAGGTTLAGGTVLVGSDTAFGTGGVLVSAQTRLGQSNPAASVTLGNAFTINQILTLLTPNAGQTLTLAGAITANQALEIEAGAGGTVALTGSNDFGGAQVRVENGTLQVNGAAALNNSALRFGGGTALDVASVSAVTLANNILLNGDISLGSDGGLTLTGAISGAGGFTKTGNSTLVLTNGASSFAGDVVLAGGRLEARNSGALGNSAAISAADGTALAVGVPLAGSVMTLGQSISIANGGGFTVDLQGDPSSFFVDQLTGTPVFDGTNLALSGDISGGALAITGGGAVRLQGNNSQSGTFIDRSVVFAESANPFGTGAIRVNEGAIFANGGAALTLGQDIVVSGILYVNGPQDVAMSGDLSNLGSGAGELGSLVKFGANSLRLDGNNSINNVRLQDGVLIAGSNNALGNQGLDTDNAAGTSRTLRAGAAGLVLQNEVSLVGPLTVDTAGETLSLAGQVFNTGSLVKAGAGNLILSGNNIYSGTTTINAGTVTAGSDTAFSTSVVTMANGTVLSNTLGADTQRSLANNFVLGNVSIDSAGNLFQLSGVLNGAGTVAKIGAGTLRITGNSANPVTGFAGIVDVQNGTLDLNGSIAGDIQVQAGASLVGTGSAAGTVTLNDTSVIAPGNSPGTLTFGNLLLANGTNVSFELGGIGAVPGTDADLIVVTNNLTLDGVLNITPLAGFNVGVGNRTLLTYGNLVANNGLTVSNAPPVDVTYTILAGPVASGPGLVQLNVAFTGTYRWDGANLVPNGVIDGGAGTLNLTNTNFTNSDGTFNLAYGNNPTDDIEFGGAAGGVDVASAVNFDQMGFVTTGYVLGGAGSLNANNSAINLGANDVTINTAITGGALAKNGTGTLTFAGTNTFSSFAVNGGTVVAASDTALGAGTATFAGGTTLAASGTPRFVNNNIVINAAGGLTIDAATNDLILSGAISGTGPLNLVSSGGAVGGRDGRIALAGVNSYTGGTTITGTTGIVGADSGLGDAAGSVTLDNAELRASGSFTTARSIALNGAVANTINTDGGVTLTANGLVSGTSALQKVGGGTLVLGNAGNSYAGGTEINAGTVSVASNGALGDPAGGVSFTGNSTLQFTADVTSARSMTIATGVIGTIDTVGISDVRLNGVISGDGLLAKIGDGRLTLTGTNTYGGGTNLNAGTLRIEDGQSISTGRLTTQDGTTFVAGLGAGAGTITLGNNITLAGGQTTIDLNGNLLIINPVTGAVSTNGTNLVLNGTITGAGGFTTSNATAGQIVINGNNSFTGDVNLNSAVVVVNNDNALGTGNTVNINAAAGIRNNTGGTTRTIGSAIAINDPNATVGGNGNITLTGVVSGADTNIFNKVGLGTVTLANAANTIASQIEVAQGELSVTGNLTNANQLTNVRAGATLSGTGSIAGIVEVANAGVLSAGVGGNGQTGTLTIGTLLLNEQSSLLFDLGDNFVLGGALNDTIAVDSLRLGGRLTVRQSTGGNFGLGVYNLFTYNTLLAGSTNVQVQSLPGAFTGLVQTLVPGQVNLIVTQPGTFVQYWDGSDATGNGAVNGGTGTWSAAGSNWTGLPDSQLNTNWFNNSVAVFGGAAGTVTLAQMFDAQGLQFVTDGYTLTGGILDNQSTGVGTGMFIATGAGVTATIDSTLQGDGILFKQGDGTLALGGNNVNFSGGTQVQAGTLQLNTALAAGTNSIALLGNTTLSNGGGVLSVANAIITTGSNAIDSNGGSFTLNGVVSGTGAVVKTGVGTLTLAGVNSYSGGTTIGAGTLAVTNNSSIGTGGLTINGGTTFQAAVNGLSFGNAVTLNGLGTVDTQGNGLTLSGLISDGGISGTLVKIGSGNLNLTGANTYSNGTNLNGGSITVFTSTSLGGGTLAMADGTSLIAGANALNLVNAVTTAGAGTINTGTNALTLSGVISGAGSLVKIGAGDLGLTNANLYAGGTALQAGSITVSNNDALGTGGLVMTGGTTLNAGAADLALANAITTLGTGTINTNAFSFTLNGVVDGAGSIVKTGTGTLVVNGANGYTGGTTVAAGTVTVGSNAALGTGLVTMADGTTLANNTDNLNVANNFSIGNATVATGANTFTMSGTIDGAGLLTKTGSGNLILTGSNSYAGGTALTAGTITIATATALGTGQLTMSDATALVAGADGLFVANGITTLGVGTVNTQANTLTLNGLIGGAGSINKTGSGNLVLNGANSYVGGTSVAAGTVTAGNNTAFGAGLVTMADGTVLANNTNNLVVANAFTIGNVEVATGANTFTMNGVVNGAGLLTKTGSGTLVLNGANGYTGGTALTAGRITVGNNTALGTAGLTMSNGTTLQAGADGLALANGITTLVAGTVDTQAFTLTLNGVIDGAGLIEKIGSGNLVLNGANTYAGGTNVVAGTVTAGNNTAFGTALVQMQNDTTLANNTDGLVIANAFDIGNVTVATGANTFTMNGVINGTGLLTKTGTGILVLNGANGYTGGSSINAGTVTVGSNTALGTGLVTMANGTTLANNTDNLNVANNFSIGNATVATGANSFTLSGTIGGAGQLTKTGSGNLILTGDNSYTGGTALTAGSITFTTDTAFGTGTITTTGGTSLVAGLNDPSGVALTLANAISLGAGTSFLALQGSSSSFQSTGLALFDGTDLTLNGVISGAGALDIADHGRVTLNGVNSYAGGTTVTNAAVFAGTDSALGTGVVTANSMFLGNNSGALRTLANDLVIAGSLVVAGSDLVAIPGADDITLNGVISGAGTLIKTSANTLTLNGANSYSGGTTLNGGRITVGSNSALGTGSLSVDEVLGFGISATSLRAGVSGLTLANNVTIGFGSLLTVESGAGVFTLNGVIGGDGVLSKIDAGNLVLNGNNSFAGGAEINAGTVTVGSNTALGISNVFMEAGTTLANNTNNLVLANDVLLGNGVVTLATGSNNFTMNAVVSGLGSITKTGSGNLILNGANLYTGGTALDAGTITVGTSTALGSGRLTAAGGTSLVAGMSRLNLANLITLNGGLRVDPTTGSFELSGDIDGQGGLTKVNSGTLILSGTNSFTGGVSLSSGTIQVNSNGALGAGGLIMADGTTLLAGAEGLALANGIITLGNGTVNTQAFTFTLNGVIGGAGSITKTGTGNLVLNGANSYTGGSFINAGTVTVGNNSALGTGLVTMADLTTLANNTDGLVVANSFSIGNVVVATGANTFTMTGGVNGQGSLTKTGVGTLVLNGGNGYAGGTILTAGTVQVGSNTALGTGDLTMFDNTQLVAGAADLALANNVTAQGQSIIDTQGLTFTLNGVLGGQGGFTKLSSGNLVLNGANTYAGGTNITAGTVTVGNATALGSSIVLMLDGTTLATNAPDLVLANEFNIGNVTVATGGLRFTLAGPIGGSGLLTKTGSGTLVLNGSNAYGGGTALTAGTIELGNNNALGTGQVTMSGGTSLVAGTDGLSIANRLALLGLGTINTQGFNFTWDGVISGDGGLAKIGAGNLVLTNSNLYAGGTLLNGGSLTVTNSAALGTGRLTMAGGTNLISGAAGLTLANSITTLGAGVIDTGAFTFTLNGVVDGAGSIVKAGSGTLAINGANTYTGGTALNAGTIRVGTGTALGTGALTMAGGTTLQAGAAGLSLGNAIGLTAGATVDVNGNMLTLGGVISGTGPLSVIDSAAVSSAALILAGTNTYTGGTVVTGTTVQVAADANLGNAAGGITLNGSTLRTTASFSTARTVALGTGGGLVETATGTTLTTTGVVSGTSLTKTGAGTLALNAANTYTGGTALNAGQITVGTNGALGTGTLTMAGGTTLAAGVTGLTTANNIVTLGAATINSGATPSAYTISGVISGAGSVTKQGTGVLTVSAANTYTGATTVAAGTLNVTGSLVSAVTVNSAAALTGTGTVGALNVLAGGSVAPGAVGTTNIATLNVTGAATLAGTYTVNVSTSAADRITAGGALTLGGTLAVAPTVPATFNQFNQVFTVASGASRTGTFAASTGLDQFGIAFAPVVEYTATAANIRLAPQSLVTLGNRFGGVTGNALQVAQAFDRAVAAGTSVQTFFNVYANGGTDLPRTLRQMSGEQRATERRVVLDSSRTIREAALDRLNGTVSMGGQQVSKADGDTSLTFWLRGAGSWGKAQPGEAATAFTTEQRGVLTGLDWKSNGLTVGGMFNYTSTDVEYQQLGGSSNVETVGGTLYAGYRKDGGLVVNAGGTVAGSRANGARAITLPSFQQSLQGTTTGTTYQLFGELAWDLAASANTRIEPFARLTYVQADFGALAETGGVAALTAAKQGNDITITNVGMRFGADVANGKVALNASASWQGTTGDRDALTVIGIASIGQNGNIRSVLIDRTALSLQADAGVNLSDTIRFSLGYSGLIGKRNDDHGGRATLNFAF